MNLLEIFRSLRLPAATDIESFESERLPGYPKFRLGVNAQGLPVLLLDIGDSHSVPNLKNLKLKNLIIQHSIQCHVSESGTSRLEFLTVIKFLSTDAELKDFFLKIAENLILSMGTSSDSTELIYHINKFAELFRAMSDSPKKSLQGLWGELLVIERATAPKHLLNYWHNDTNDKFDFNAGKEKIEVKTSANFERIHFFSAEQLYNVDGDFILIASIFLKQSSLGLTIFQLCDLIKERIGFDIELIEKINSIIFHTLGNSLEHSHSIRYDYQIAAESLSYYNQKDIVHLSLKDIPKEISHVKYRSDLSSVPMFVRNPEDDYGLLINICFD